MSTPKVELMQAGVRFGRIEALSDVSIALDAGVMESSGPTIGHDDGLKCCADCAFDHGTGRSSRSLGTREPSDASLVVARTFQRSASWNGAMSRKRGRALSADLRHRPYTGSSMRQTNVPTPPSRELGGEPG